MNLENIHEINMIINLFSIIYLGIIMVALVYRKKLTKKSNILLITMVLVLANLLDVMKQEIMADFSQAFYRDILGIAAIGFYILYMFLSEEGKIAINKKTLTENAVVLIVPFIITIIIKQLLPELNFAYVLLTFSISISYMIYQLQIEKELIENEKELIDTRVKTLMEQIQSHFIFNCLMSIQGLCEINPEKASKAIADFSEYLRGNMMALEDIKMIPFSQELEHIQEYVSLEKIEPNNQFEMVYELEEVDFLIPPLTVQPIVENAIQYGALAREGGGKIILRTTKNEKGFIRITVEDIGKGNIQLTKNQEKHNGISIKNIQKRLKLQCDGKIDIIKKDNGTIVEIIVKN
ncbi:MAG: histidine kinase [Clostridia bacterium]|nr:histidine kinase [Clostridia bacterium]